MVDASELLIGQVWEAKKPKKRGYYATDKD